MHSAPRRAACSRPETPAGRRALARALGRAGVRPNAVSIASVVFALAAGVAFYRRPGRSRPEVGRGCWSLAAAAIQLRLLCNLLDGMLAVEEGLEDQDRRHLQRSSRSRRRRAHPGRRRVLDSRISPGGVTLGWAAAVAALFTAYVRLLGGSLGVDAALHRPDGQAASDVHADAGDAARRRSKRCSACRRARCRIGLGVDRRGIDRDRLAAHGAHRARSGRAMIATALARSSSRLVSGATVAVAVRSATRTRQRDLFRQSLQPPGFRRHLVGASAGAAPVACGRSPGSDYWEQGPVRRYLAGRVFHAVLIERAPDGCAERRRRAARASIQRMADEIGDRHSLIVFPEGHARRWTARSARSRAACTTSPALRPDVELIPVYLENLNRILPKGKFLPVPMLSRVVFGRRCRTSRDEDKDAFLARARDGVDSAERPCHESSSRPDPAAPAGRRAGAAGRGLAIGWMLSRRVVERAEPRDGRQHQRPHPRLVGDGARLRGVGRRPARSGRSCSSRSSRSWRCASSSRSRRPAAAITARSSGASSW